MITHDHKLIFIHIPKCAGRSVSDAFNQRFDHFTLGHYKREYLSCYMNYTTFTIVRNPYDRLVSLFHYIREHRRHVDEPIFCGFGDFKKWLIGNMIAFDRRARGLSPELERGTDGDIGSPFQFAPQWQFLSIIDPDGHNCKYGLGRVDHIFRFEDLAHVRVFLSKFGASLNHLNSSKHDHWLSYYDGELMEYCRCFKPIVEDCRLFDYELL